MHYELRRIDEGLPVLCWKSWASARVLPSDLLILRGWGGESHLNGRGAVVGAQGQPEVSRAQEPAWPILTARHLKSPAPTSEGERDSSLKEIT